MERVRWAAFLVAVAMAAACGSDRSANPLPEDGEGSANRPPEITSLVVDPLEIPAGGGASVTVVAKDPDGDAVAYAFTAEHGTLDTEGAVAGCASYTHDASPGETDHIRVVVTDSSGAQATAEREVKILWGGGGATPGGGGGGTPEPTPTPEPTATPVPTPTPTPPPTCPNGACDAGETCGTCPGDCPCTGATRCESGACVLYCGNGACDNGETCSSCAGDCGSCCGNGTCQASLGENCSTCVADCRCTGPTRCQGGTCVRYCGNHECDNGETCDSCPADCGNCCGQGGCQSQYGENCATCPGDCPCPASRRCESGVCALYCGNHQCDGGIGETCNNCQQDCGACCGQGGCQPAYGENCSNCADCACGSGHVCLSGSCAVQTNCTGQIVVSCGQPCPANACGSCLCTTGTGGTQPLNCGACN